MILDALTKLSHELRDADPDIADELLRLAVDITAYKKRGPQGKKRWHRRKPIQRRKRRRWERTPGGRRYKRKKQRVERRPTVKRYRKRLKRRGIHRKYPWLRSRRR